MVRYHEHNATYQTTPGRWCGKRQSAVLDEVKVTHDWWCMCIQSEPHTGELGYDRLNGTRKIGPSYAKSVVYIWRILDMHQTGTKHIVRHMQKSVVQWSVISKFTCITIGFTVVGSMCDAPIVEGWGVTLPGEHSNIESYTSVSQSRFTIFTWGMIMVIVAEIYIFGLFQGQVVSQFWKKWSYWSMVAITMAWGMAGVNYSAFHMQQPTANTMLKIVMWNIDVIRLCINCILYTVLILRLFN